MDAAAPPETQEEGFRLVLQVMSEQKVEHVPLAAPPGEQPVPRGARQRLEVGAGHLPFPRRRPAEHMMGNAALAQPCLHPARFGARSGAEAMVDGERRHPPSPGPRPTLPKQAERHAVGATGHRDGEMGGPLEGSQRRHQGAELRRVQGLGHRCG